jgi:hypothetical protein
MELLRGFEKQVGKMMKPTNNFKNSVTEPDGLNSSVVASTFMKEFNKINAPTPEGRLQALKSAINKALNKAGLPPIKEFEIESISNTIDKNAGGQGTYDPEGSTMVVNSKLLEKLPLPIETALTIYHEAVHHQQAYNVARYLATPKPNGRGMTAQEIKAAVKISGITVDQAVASKKPLTSKQLKTAQNIYNEGYSKENFRLYNGKKIPYLDWVNASLDKSKSVYKEYNKEKFRTHRGSKNPYSDWVYERFVSAKDAHSANSNAETRKELVASRDLYNELTQEREAFDVERLVGRSNKQVSQKSIQDKYQEPENISENYSATDTVSNESDKILDNDISTNSPKIHEGNSVKESNATNVSKVVKLLRENAAEVKQRFGVDATTSEGLSQAVIMYWIENKFDIQILRDKLPQTSDSEFAIAMSQANSALSSRTNAVVKDEQLTL